MDHNAHGFPFPPIFEWRKLVHVCQRWRHIVFASPIRLGLQLLCTYGTPVRKNLGHWPPFPLVIDYCTYWGADGGKSLALSDEDDVIAALEHPGRVRYVRISVTGSMLGRMAAAVQEPFPMLTHLWLSSEDENVPALPGEFLGGSAPSLRVAHLAGIPFPPMLLSSALGLVDLRLLDIPHDGYISPEAMVAGLAALTGLRTLFIGFNSPTPLSRSRRSDPITRMGLPSLTTFNFRGVSEYLEDLVAQIDTPLLKNFTIMYFNQLAFQIPQLSQFISRTESLDLSRSKHARVGFGGRNVYVRLGCDQAEQLEGHFTLQISCQRLEWQVSHMAQVLGQCFANATLSSVDDLSIDARDLQPGWEEDADSTEWPGLLRPFTAVETLHVSKKLGGHVTEEMAAEILTVLQSLCFEDEPTGVDP